MYTNVYHSLYRLDLFRFKRILIALWPWYSPWASDSHSGATSQAYNYIRILILLNYPNVLIKFELLLILGKDTKHSGEQSSAHKRTGNCSKRKYHIDAVAVVVVGVDTNVVMVVPSQQQIISADSATVQNSHLTATMQANRLKTDTNSIRITNWNAQTLWRCNDNKCSLHRTNEKWMATHTK